MTDDSLGGAARLIGRVLNRFQADVAAGHPVMEIHAIADGENVVSRRAHCSIDLDAVHYGQTRGLCQFDVRHDADADNDQACGNGFAIAQFDAGHAAVAADNALNSNAGAHFDAGFHETSMDMRSDDCRHAATKHTRLSFNHRYPAPTGMKRCGDFQTDEAAADDHNVLRAMSGLTDTSSVGDVAQRHDALELRAWQAQGAGTRAQGKNCMIELKS